MARRIWWLIVLALPVSGAGLDFNVDIVSEYVLHGASRGQGMSLQPSLRYNIVDTLTASLWSNVRLEGSLGVSETDYALDWAWARWAPAKLSAGWVYYDANRALVGPETAELFVGVDFDLPAQPSLYLWYDYDAYPGLFWDLGVKHQVLLPDYRGTVDLSGQLLFDTGRLNRYYSAALSVAVSRYIGEWRVSPGLELYFPTDAADPSGNGFRPVFRLSASRSF